MSQRIKKILTLFKKEIKGLYGKKVKRVLLYGSWARGTAHEESDIDIVVVINAHIIPGKEIDKMIGIITEINLKYEVLISVYPISVRNFSQINSPLLLNIRKEAIAI